EKNKKSIASYIKFPQFTTMNVIDGQAGLVFYSSLFFYSLTINNILNIVVLLILAGVAISAITGNENAMKKAKEAKNTNEAASELETIKLAVVDAVVHGTTGYLTGSKLADALIVRVLDETEDATQLENIRNNENGDWKVKGKYGKYKINRNGEVTESSLTIGSSVPYSTRLNNVTLDNWKIFYEKGDYTYLILSDYLPSAAVNISGVLKNPNTIYSVYTNTTRVRFVSTMTNKANWDSLLKGTINGKEVQETRTQNVWAMGSPTLELWVSSWNEKYPENKLYMPEKSSLMSDGLKAYYIGQEENTSETSTSLNETVGYQDTLYFPHQEGLDNEHCVRILAN
ncbi:MAG: hypothetical protein IKF38_07050, partial [Clostridia bacterium]|nr:hypothetical protein [Clostridia bacterium]